MPAQYVTSIVEGQDFYVADIDPTGVVSAVRGSLCLRVDSGNALVYLNTTTSNAPGTTWVPLLSTDWTDIGTQITLLDNANPALQVGPAGFLDLLKFITTNGAEQIVMRSSSAAVQITGGFGLNFSSSAAKITSTNPELLDIGSNGTGVSTSTSGVGAVVYKNFAVPANGGGVSVDTPFVLTNQRNLQLIDAWIISGGAGGVGQSVQVLNNALASITGAMQPGGAGGITRNPSFSTGNATFTPGQTLYARSAAGTVAATLYAVFVVA